MAGEVSTGIPAWAVSPGSTMVGSKPGVGVGGIDWKGVGVGGYFECWLIKRSEIGITVGESSLVNGKLHPESSMVNRIIAMSVFRIVVILLFNARLKFS